MKSMQNTTKRNNFLTTSTFNALSIITHIKCELSIHLMKSEQIITQCKMHIYAQLESEHTINL